MKEIPPRLQQNPRFIVINKKDGTWWEVGNDGEDYATTVDPSVFHRLKDKPLGRGGGLIKSVRYEWEIV